MMQDTPMADSMRNPHWPGQNIIGVVLMSLPTLVSLLSFSPSVSVRSASESKVSSAFRSLLQYISWASNSTLV